MPLLTFIITYHNEPLDLLRQCLQSILSLPLTADEREIMVVDDGSRVSAEEMVSSLDSAVLYVRQSPSGLSVARNSALRLVRGRYVQFVDADDMLLPLAYTDVLELLRKEEPDMLMFHFTHEPADRLSRPLLVKRTDGVSFLKQYNMRASACCYVFSAEMLGDLRFEPHLLHEDELFTPLLLLRMTRPERVLLLSCAPYYYRRHGETITQSGNNSERIARRLDCILRILQMLSAHADKLDGEPKEALNRRVAQLTMDYIYNVYLLTHSVAELHRSVRTLREQGLFPLPLRAYTPSYFLFSLFSRVFLLFL